MPNLYSRLLFITMLVVCSGLAVGCAGTAETDRDGRLFRPSADALADVQQALGRADEGDRLALVVLGANWCHDSRALAARLPGLLRGGFFRLGTLDCGLDRVFFPGASLGSLSGALLRRLLASGT